MPDFARQIVLWQRRFGRHDLPWQGTRDPYLIWVSEVMLQQTQVVAAIFYYERFMARFPSVAALAAAEEDEVLRLWSGLGYYARGRNLLRAAIRIQTQHRGRFPREPEALTELPGIGRSTAGAIAVFSFGARAAILDGNVKRVLARCFGIEGYPGVAMVERRLWSLAESLLPARGVERYTQGLMDLGATVCTRNRPDCERCPVAELCVARRSGRVNELPQARLRKAVPRRRVTWIVLRHRGQVLLERRPSAGLWGGLWTFPELARGDTKEYCRREFGCTLSHTRRLAPIEHGFTHFKLTISPLLCDVARASPRAEQSGRIWISIEDAAHAAVPTPVRKLLRNLVVPADLVVPAKAGTQ
ncbi:MAG: A/G-specific adenine glycosylase [Betaproteobacteria bacterium]|nr:A/G-specific adenine glycosylase [Betaproteobacteria bacterium]